MKENEIKNNENNDIEIKNDDLTNASFLKEPLSDEELDSISGGFGGSGPINGVIAIRKDSKGNNTHWQITRYKKQYLELFFTFAVLSAEVCCIQDSSAVYTVTLAMKAGLLFQKQKVFILDVNNMI